MARGMRKKTFIDHSALLPMYSTKCITGGEISLEGDDFKEVVGEKLLKQLKSFIWRIEKRN